MAKKKKAVKKKDSGLNDNGTVKMPEIPKRKKKVGPIEIEALISQVERLTLDVLNITQDIVNNSQRIDRLVDALSKSKKVKGM